MLDFRKRIYVIVGVVVGLIISLVLFLLYFHSPKSQVSKEINSGISQTGEINTPQSTSVSPATVSKPLIQSAKQAKLIVPPADFYVKQLSGIFIERFLSFSNQNNNQHLYDVVGLVTEKMAKWVMAQAVKPSGEYQGINTTVVASSIKTITADKATVLVGVQRVYEGKESKTEYKSGQVELVKVGQEWKVDGFYWDK